jgi:prepilin-type processing-associated H-X9-DG protein
VKVKRSNDGNRFADDQDRARIAFADGHAASVGVGWEKSLDEFARSRNALRDRHRRVEVIDEIDPPGVIWAGTFTNDGWRFTIGKGLNDDRYIYRYSPNEGFTRLFACPDFTGSYLSFDGEHYYLSQWYTGLIHKVDDSGKVLRTIDVEAEICGHTFVDGMLYVLRGRENKDVPNKTEEWRIARLDPREEAPEVEDLATIPFAARSLTHDGEKFWSNHRAANKTISFTISS